MKMDRGRLAITSLVALLTLESLAAIDRMGGEYSVLGRQAGDQFFPKLSVGNHGGYLVWHDNNIDEEGLGIRAVCLDANFNEIHGDFRVNEAGRGDQQRPVVTSLLGGGAAFAWESGGNIMIRFVNEDGIFVGHEQRANHYFKSVQRDPAIATLSSGNVILVWSSLGQDGSMQGIYGQRFSPSGDKLGAEFLVNQLLPFNQRTPAVASLENGFVVAWISEQLAGIAYQNAGQNPPERVGIDRYEVCVKGRIFAENGNAISNEFLLGNPNYINANPALAAAGGGFFAFYSGRENVQKSADLSNANNSWDIFGQRFDKQGMPIGEAMVINENRFGDQIVPSASRMGDSVFVAWTSLGQDGDREGIFGRVIAGDSSNSNSSNSDSTDSNSSISNSTISSISDSTNSNSSNSSEFQINSIVVNRQLLPAVGANADGKAVVVWGGFRGGRDSFDLQAQKFSLGNSRFAPESPFVFPKSYWTLGVSWEGIEEAESYALFLDGGEAIFTKKNMHDFSGLNAGNEHSVQLAYVFSGGRLSPKSAAVSASTWGRDENFDGLPDDWQERFFGDERDFPSDLQKRDADFDGDGLTNLQELLAGTDPTDSQSLLQTKVESTDMGLRLRWNAKPGGFYQVQVSHGVGELSWADVGSPRLAVDDFDSISINGNREIEIYRVIKVQ